MVESKWWLCSSRVFWGQVVGEAIGDGGKGKGKGEKGKGKG